MATVGPDTALRRILRILRRLIAERRRIAGERATTRPAEPVVDVDRLRVSYDPRRDGEADPGEVVWAWVPYEDDPSRGKDRPVLIIGRIGSRLAGIPLSTTDRNGGAHANEWVTVGTGPWDSQGRTSHAHISRPLAFEPDGIRREGAALDRARFDEIVAAVRAFDR